MEIFIIYGVSSIILISFLFAIVDYKTTHKTGVFVEVLENDSLTENQRKQIKIRPLKSYYYSRYMPVLFTICLIMVLFTKITLPKLPLFMHQVALQIGFLALFYYFKPSHFLDPATIIISDESMTGTGGSTVRCILMMYKQITFPIKNIDSQASKNLKLSRMQRWFGYRYIYSTDGQKILLSRLVFTKKQISEILNEVEKLSKGIAEDQAHETEQDKVD